MVHAAFNTLYREHGFLFRDGLLIDDSLVALKLYFKLRLFTEDMFFISFSLIANILHKFLFDVNELVVCWRCVILSPCCALSYGPSL